MEESQGRLRIQMSSLENGVMKRLVMFLVAMSIMSHLTGCGVGRFCRSRGARCGAPRFKMPSMRQAPAPAAAPCANGACSATTTPGIPYSTTMPYSETTPYMTAPPVEYPSDGWGPPPDATSSYEVSPSIESEQPIYAGRPAVSREIVSGPEFGEMPTQ